MAKPTPKVRHTSRQILDALEGTSIVDVRAYVRAYTVDGKYAGSHSVIGRADVRIPGVGGGPSKTVRMLSSRDVKERKVGGRILASIGEGVTPGQVRSKAARSRLGSLVDEVVRLVDEAVELKKADPSLPEEIRREGARAEEFHREKMRKEAEDMRTRALRHLRGYLSDPSLKDMTEEQLLELFRSIRISEVMES
jgi:hypothetical protein